MYMNFNYNYSTTIYESILAKIHLFMVEKHFFCNFCLNFFHGKKQKLNKKKRNTYIWATILSYTVVR